MNRFALVLAIFTGSALAAEPIRITFLPPPLDGTLSTGVYTREGKLVRTLSAEAREDAFIIGLNGLTTSWDGNDDTGMPTPAGKYFVRGYSVGELQIAGSAVFGNDWVDAEDDIVIRDIGAVRLEGRDLVLDVTTPAGETGVLRENLETGARSYQAQPAPQTPPLQEVAGKDGTLWRIEEDAVIQRKDDEILRQLSFGPDDPKPMSIAAATDREELFLLERSPLGVQLRGLRLKQVKSEEDGRMVSEWEIFFDREIAKQDTFEQAVAALERPERPVAEETLRVGLVPNELLQVAPAAVNLAAGFDAKGSFLRTADGLLLRRISDTPHLKWAVLIRSSDGTPALLEGNGAVIQEYRLIKVDQMMAFEAGKYDWAGAELK